MMNRAPRYIRPFDDLEKEILTAFPKEYENFQFYYQDFLYKLRHVEIIVWRFENEKANFEEAQNRNAELRKKKKSFSPKDYFKKQVEVGKMLMTSTELMNLDADSFFIFSRILLDRVPYLLKPFFKGLITQCEPSIIDFKNHLRWFKDNPKYVIDSTYAEKLASVKTWFENKLRYPRNEIIVHQKGKHYVQGVGIDGTLIRLRYVLKNEVDNKAWVPVEIEELTDITALMKYIMEFLIFLNQYFCEILKSFREQTG